MNRGTYTLVIDLDRDATIEVGALGTHEFDRGWYAYTGSAFGRGGFSRVERHRELSRGESTTRHWHVDYLLGHEAARIRTVVQSPGLDAECVIAGALPDAGIEGFGASDCSCPSHLAFHPEGPRLTRLVSIAHEDGR